MDGFIDIGSSNQIPVGRGAAFTVGSLSVAVFATGDQIFAIENRCPHRGAMLSEGCHENATVYCPMHGWQFELATGNCLDKPEKPVKTYPAKVINGRVWVKIVE